MNLFIESIYFRPKSKELCLMLIEKVTNTSVHTCVVAKRMVRTVYCLKAVLCGILVGYMVSNSLHIVSH